MGCREIRRRELLARRIRLCQIGNEIGRKGMQDDDIIVLLQRLRRSTFITRDGDFFKKSLCSERYCLAFLDIRPAELAKYVRLLLRHADFKTWSQRRGCVMRVFATGIAVWKSDTARAVRHVWDD